MIKGLPRLSVHRNGAVTNEYEYVADNNFEQKERTLKKRIRRLCLNLKEKNTPIYSLRYKSTRGRIISLRGYRDDPWERVDTISEYSHNVPCLKFIRWIDRKSRIDPDYFE